MHDPSPILNLINAQPHVLEIWVFEVENFSKYLNAIPAIPQ